MALIDEIRLKVGSGEFEYSQHAVDQTTLRHIAVQELREAIANGEVIEDYPNDKYGPSCLERFHRRSSAILVSPVD